jgi:hypothetical protein
MIAGCTFCGVSLLGGLVCLLYNVPVAGRTPNTIAVLVHDEDAPVAIIEAAS